MLFCHFIMLTFGEKKGTFKLPKELLWSIMTVLPQLHNKNLFIFLIFFYYGKHYYPCSIWS